MWNNLNRSMMFCQMLFGLSYYGVMGILTPFFLELGYSEEHTLMILGAFSAIGPLFAVSGGFIADKFLGAYRALTISCIGFAAGYVLLVLAAWVRNVPLALCGIALASYFRGLMSPSYPSLYKRTFKTRADFENGIPVNYIGQQCGRLFGDVPLPCADSQGRVPGWLPVVRVAGRNRPRYAAVHAAPAAGRGGQDRSGAGQH
jgi:dipeptide/tripeptide permease